MYEREKKNRYKSKNSVRSYLSYGKFYKMKAKTL